MNTSLHKNKELIVFCLTFFAVAAVTFLAFHYKRVSYTDLLLENSETSYAKRDEFEEDYPESYAALENSSGVELSKLLLMPSDRVFVNGADGFQFLAGETEVFIFRFKNVKGAKQAIAGFSKGGNTYKDPTTNTVSILYFPYPPRVFVKDREMVVLIGNEDYIVDIVKGVMGDEVKLL